MRGNDKQNGWMFSYISPEDRVPADHPLRIIRRVTDRALERLSTQFDTLYINFGRPSVPPEKLLRALLLQALYSVRSERLLMEQLEYNILFRWFVGLGMDDPVWDPTTFTKNRDRLVRGDIAAAFFDAVLLHADSQRLLSDDHFTVDGTLLEAWASQKSFRPRDEDPPSSPGGGNPAVDFHRQRRTNATHQSTTDPDARLYKKARGREARLGYLGHVMMEHRSGLIVKTAVTAATGHAERDAALVMVETLPGRRRVTLAGDKGYDTRDFVAELRRMTVTPHVAQHTTGRRSAIDQRTTRHPGYAVSQRKRKLVEQGFGWMKTVGGLRKLRHRGGPLVAWIFTFAAAAYNIVRLRQLLTATA
jgi:transposase